MRRVVQRVLLGVLLLIGIAGQVRVWASDRGLWNDELSIALTLKYVPFGKLTGELLYRQTAPPGWLAVEKAILNVLGPDEQWLKLPEVAAAVVVLLLTAVAAHYAIGRWASLVAVGLVATSPMIYMYAGELKQYAFEAAVAMVILVVAGWYGTAAIGRTLPGWRRVATFAAVCAVASAGSYSSLMVLSGAAAGIGLLQMLRRRWLALVVTVLAATPGLLVGTVQAVLRRRLEFLPNQNDFFPRGLAPEHAGPSGILRWLPDMWQGFVVSPLSWHYPVVALILVVGGLVSLVIRRRPLWAAMIGGVFAAAVGAGALRGFPIEGRVALYLVAPTAVAVAAAADGAGRALVGAVHGLRRAVSRCTGRVPAMARLAVAALLAAGLSAGLAVVVRPAAVDAYHEVDTPTYRDAGRDMLRDVAARARPGDVVLAYYFSERLLSWYGQQFRLPPTHGLAILRPISPCSLRRVGMGLAGADRVWYVYGRRLSAHPQAYNDWVVAHLARLGTVVETSDAFLSTGWALIDLRAGPDPDPPPIGTDPAYACLRIRPPPVW